MTPTTKQDVTRTKASTTPAPAAGRSLAAGRSVYWLHAKIVRHLKTVYPDDGIIYAEERIVRSRTHRVNPNYPRFTLCGKFIPCDDRIDFDVSRGNDKVNCKMCQKASRA